MERKILSECVIAKIDIDGERILAKNRDRGYFSEVQIVHEIVNGIEICYLYDCITDWSEGLNELGIGIINSALSVSEDEKEGIISKRKKKPKLSNDGMKIRKILCQKNMRDAIKTMIFYSGLDPKNVGVTGHTIIANPLNTYILEMTSQHKPVLKRKKNKILTRSNHGIYHKDAGYNIPNIKRFSSLNRMKIVDNKLKDASCQDDVLDIMLKQHTKYNFLNPYRRSNEFNMQSTAQIMYNLNKLEFILRCDINHSKFTGYLNRLPKDYEPKIKVKVEFVE